jgi:hypothetical protein
MIEGLRKGCRCYRIGLRGLWDRDYRDRLRYRISGRLRERDYRDR